MRLYRCTWENASIVPLCLTLWRETRSFDVCNPHAHEPLSSTVARRAHIHVHVDRCIYTLQVFGNRTLGTHVLLAAEHQHICTCPSIARWAHTHTHTHVLLAADCQANLCILNTCLGICIARWAHTSAARCRLPNTCICNTCSGIKTKQHVFESHAGHTQVLLAAYSNVSLLATSIHTLCMHGRK